MVDEQDELPEDDRKEDWELPENQEDEFVGNDDFKEAFEGDNDDFEGINEVIYDSNKDLEGSNFNSGEYENDFDGNNTAMNVDLDKKDIEKLLRAAGGGGGGEELAIESGEGGIEFRPLPGEGKLKNPFKYFKE